MKFFLACMGPGETAQAAHFGKFLESEQNEVVFGLEKPSLGTILGFEQGKPAPYASYFCQTPSVLWSAVQAERPDVLLFFNSKIFRQYPDFRNLNPQNGPWTASVDSNWLFRQEPHAIYPFVRWVHKHFIILPQKVFDFGLKENGGDYAIDPSLRKKFEIVGLLPSTLTQPPLHDENRQDIREELGVAEHERLVFLYSGFGTTEKADALNDYFAFASEHPHTRVLFLGRNERIPKAFQKAPFITAFPQLSFEKFSDYLRASDLLIQHQGIGTLAQSIASLIPTIANVSPEIQVAGEHSHFWELNPFAKAGACTLHRYNDPHSKKEESFHDLLNNIDKRTEMKHAQAALQSESEQYLLDSIIVSMESKNLSPQKRKK